ncbi:MAG: TetR/AcrR family transcriptional regulator, partial [Phormidesmis sp.]
MPKCATPMVRLLFNLQGSISMPLYKQKTISREEETQERILKAAQKLFARRGYGGTTTRDLAQAA